MYRHIIFAAFVSGMSASSVQAANCAMREQVVSRLQAKYSEQLTAGGLQGVKNTQAVIEVWASPETGTFTVMQTQPNGVSCIVATGTEWFSQAPTLADKGADS